MYISITSIRLKTGWHFFSLSSQALQILRQLKKSEGYLQMKKRGLGLTHYTLSVWESKEAMQAFMRQGAHAKSMQQAAKIAKTIGSYGYQSDQIPSWKVAKELLKEKGRFINY